MPLSATWMDLEILLSSDAKSDKDNHHMTSLIWNLKKKRLQMSLSYKTKIELEMQKINLQLPGGKGGEDKLKDWN